MEKNRGQLGTLVALLTQQCLNGDHARRLYLLYNDGMQTCWNAM